MSRKKILVVDDEKDILELISHHLKREGYDYHCVNSGNKVIGAIGDFKPDLVLLDLMLPEVDGLELCRQIRANKETSHLPIIMLTAKSEDTDVVLGLELGADDYVTKPFSPKILLARIRKIFRRQNRPQDKIEEIKIADINIDCIKHEVTVSGAPVQLTYTEFEVLKLLAGKPGWVFSRSKIVDAIRGDNYAVTDRSVDVQIVGLRRKLGEQGKLIETIRGIGYKMKE